MASLNKVMLLGNIGQEPEIKTTQSGKEFANLSIATTESWKDKNSGEKKEKTERHKIVCFNEGLVKVIKQYCHKGDKLYIEGQMRTRKWEKDGQTRYTTEVVLGSYTGNLVMCSSKPSNSQSKPVQVNDVNYPTKAQASQKREEDYLDDDIPF